MKFNLLGSGGVFAPPRPCCFCAICTRARELGKPYYKTGCSLYNYDANLLFDTPEEIRRQLNAEKIRKIDRIILTHWHPDHTLGLRVIEQLNRSPTGGAQKPIDVYISKDQLDMFKKFSCGSFLDYYQNTLKIIRVNIFREHDILDFDSISVEPILIRPTKGFYFIIRAKMTGRKLVYAPCEYHGLQVHESAKGADVLISHHLYYKDRSIGKFIDFSKEEDCFEQMLCHAKEIGSKRIIITHIEELFGLNHDELNKISKEKFPEFNIEYGYDGMIIDV